MKSITLNLDHCANNGKMRIRCIGCIKSIGCFVSHSKAFFFLSSAVSIWPVYMITPSSRPSVKLSRSSSLSFPHWRTFSTSLYLYVPLPQDPNVSRWLHLNEFPFPLWSLHYCHYEEYIVLLQWKWLSISDAVMLMHVLLCSQCCKIPYQTLQGIMQCVYVCFSANRIQGLRRPSCLMSSVRFTSPPTVHRWTCSPTSSAATWLMWSSTSPVFTGQTLYMIFICI